MWNNVGMKTNKVDTLDEKLIRLLQQDARRSSDALAKRLQVSPATVRRRVRNLIRKGVVRIAAIPDPAKVGLPVAAIIAMKVDRERLRDVMSGVASRPEVGWVCATTGRFDLVAIARFHTTEELSKFLQSELPRMQGIEDSETFLCLDMRQK